MPDVLRLVLENKADVRGSQLEYQTRFGYQHCKITMNGGDTNVGYDESWI